MIDWLLHQPPLVFATVIELGSLALVAMIGVLMYAVMTTLT